MKPRKFYINSWARIKNFEAYLVDLREALCGREESLLAYKIQDTGCYTHSLIVKGPEAESFVRLVAMVLDGKYAEYDDDSTSITEGEFKDYTVK